MSARVFSCSTSNSAITAEATKQGSLSKKEKEGNIDLHEHTYRWYIMWNHVFIFFLERLLAQSDETQKAFSQFCYINHLKLSLYLQPWQFENKFCKVLFLLIDFPFWSKYLVFTFLVEALELGSPLFPHPVPSWCPCFFIIPPPHLFSGGAKF